MDQGYAFHSSRICEARGSDLGRDFLRETLRGADSYDRIAGYFCASIVDVAGAELDELASKGKVRVVCNARLDFVESESQGVGAAAMDEFLWSEWTAFKRDRMREVDVSRLTRLHRMIKAGRMEVRILPDGRLGLLHGKAGLVSKNGKATSFLGSANESLGGWRRNYELVAESSEAGMVDFVRGEFEALWEMAAATPLPKRIVDDCLRVACREELPPEAWRKAPDPGQALDGMGKMPRGYQKWFVDMAFRDHAAYPWGARYVLSDPVGLGKTMQLGLSMKLFALMGLEGPEASVLAVVPKTLMAQWQSELVEMGVPSAFWHSMERRWKCEDGSFSRRWNGRGEPPACPRRLGLVSMGIASAGADNAFRDALLRRRYECVVVDEAHRARKYRSMQSPYASGKDNNLFDFMLKVSALTRSMLLGTATPVQLHPVEAWDLLNVLSADGKFPAILGSDASRWRVRMQDAVECASDPDSPVRRLADERDRWAWLNDPLPFPRLREGGPHLLDKPVERVREILGLDEPRGRPVEDLAEADGWQLLSDEAKARLSSPLADLWGNPAKRPEGSVLIHTPFVRRFVRRSRDALERIGKAAGGLDRIEVDLRGESTALEAPPEMEEAFGKADEFAKSFGSSGSGFVKTLLKRRLGSSRRAGIMTADAILDSWAEVADDEEEDEPQEFDDQPKQAGRKSPKGATRELTAGQREILTDFLALIMLSDGNPRSDPKFALLKRLLASGDPAVPGDGPWLDGGCIVFSQYYATAEHFARMASGDMPGETVGLYAGSDRSMLLRGGVSERVDRETIKRMVWEGKIKLLFGTDAASEGLNLQVLASLVNLDLPWNPTRLEQRKGRIQREGQRPTVRVYNMRYAGSVEDDVHERLGERLKHIAETFGQIPDCLEQAWIFMAQNQVEEAERLIQGFKGVPMHHVARYYDVDMASDEVSWDEEGRVLSAVEVGRMLRVGWVEIDKGG